MHIGIILGSFPVLSESFIRNETRALREVGIPTDIVAMVPEDASTLSKRDQELAHTAYYLPHLPVPSWRELLGFIPNMLSAFAFLLKQRKLSLLSLLYQGIRLAIKGRKQGWTQIHTHFAWGHSAYAIVAAKLLGVPITMTCHGSDIYATPEDLEAKLDYCDGVIAVCDAMKKTLSAQTNTPIHMIPCGVDTEYFQPPAIKKSNGRLLFVGRLIDCKGVDDLLHAIADLSPKQRLPLDIVGDGPLRTELEELCTDLQLNEIVSFLGAKPSDWLQQHAPYYRALVSAFRRGRDGAQDTGPVIIKEAMAMGLPIVSTEFMGIPNMVAPENGILVPPGNRKALGQALFQIWDKPEAELFKMGENGRERCLQEFHIQKQIHELSIVFSFLAQLVR
ncbi:MAG: glycosyltransferase [Rickettsiales bacterium]|nr:glycosyltransferase [Rickettsiales bacterium]